MYDEGEVLTEYALASAFRYKIGSVSNKFRLTIHAGLLLPTSNILHFDIGFGFIYNINKNYSITLIQRGYYHLPSPEYINPWETPDVLMLNLNYKLRV